MRTAAEFVNGIRYQDLGSETIQKAKECVLDFVGATLGGAKTKAAGIALACLRDLGGAQQAALWPTTHKAPCTSAAFFHGTTGTSLDIDDGHRMARGHPGGVTIPAALAISEHYRKSGKDLIEAVVCGYEVGIRAGHIVRIMNPQIQSLGSGRWGSTAAAAAAAKLLGLGVEATEQALAISATYAPVAPATDDLVKEGMMPMTKVSSGWGAMLGTWSALLAQQGFTGVRAALDFSLGSLPRLGKAFEIVNVYFKPYSCCRWTHPAIEGIIQLMNEHSGLGGKIKKIEVRTFRDATRLNNCRPRTMESAQYSIPFLVSVAAFHGEVSPELISEERLSDPAILRIAEKVEVVHAPELDDCFPKTAPCEINLEDTAGKVYRTRVDRPRGDPFNPLSSEEFLAKFKRLAAASIDAKAAEDVISIISKLETLSNVADLTARLQAGV